MIELNYPIKYALQPVKGRRTNRDGEEFFIDECYIISKVYVMEEHTKYLENGNYGGNYKICYPYTVYSDGINFEKKTPIDYHKQDHEATVFYLYNSYEDASVAKDKRNVLISEEVVEKYQPFEDTILELTNDMVVDTEEKVKTKRKI